MQNHRTSLIFKKDSQLSDIALIAEEIATSLSCHSEFCLLMDAKMGAGKTTLSKSIMKALGLTDPSLVTSPTYTYINEYQVGASWYAHLDLYRLEGSDDLLDLGLNDIREYKGYLVEWPYAVKDTYPLIPSHILTIDSSFEDYRTYNFYQIIEK